GSPKPPFAAKGTAADQTTLGCHRRTQAAVFRPGKSPTPAPTPETASPGIPPILMDRPLGCHRRDGDYKRSKLRHDVSVPRTISESQSRSPPIHEGCIFAADESCAFHVPSVGR